MSYKITLFLLLIISSSSIAYKPNEDDKAPDFEITSITGETFKLSDYKGKKSVYIVFWNTWCHYCMKKIPKLKEVQNNLANEIMIIAINTSRDDTVKEVKDFQNRFKINYMLAFDDNEVITDLYNVHGVPTEFIIDIDGVIQHRDGVPNKLEKFIRRWNTSKNSISQSLLYYIDLAATFINKVKNTS